MTCAASGRTPTRRSAESSRAATQSTPGPKIPGPRRHSGSRSKDEHLPDSPLHLPRPFQRRHDLAEGLDLLQAQPPPGPRGEPAIEHLVAADPEVPDRDLDPLEAEGLAIQQHPPLLRPVDARPSSRAARPVAIPQKADRRIRQARIAAQVELDQPRPERGQAVEDLP